MDKWIQYYKQVSSQINLHALQVQLKPNIKYIGMKKGKAYMAHIC